MPRDTQWAMLTGFVLALLLFVLWDLHHIMLVIDGWFS
jgi:hypothetical protein